jgi:biopolymer transport protein ExbB/TolQ
MAESASEFVRRNPTALGLIVAIISFAFHSYGLQSEMKESDADHERRISQLETRTHERLASIENNVNYMRGRLEDVLDAQRMDELDIRRMARDNGNKTE